MQPDLERLSRRWNDRHPDPDLDRLLAAAAVVSFGFLVASWVPLPLTWLVFSEIMTLAALVAAVAASLRREPLFPGHVTGWDQAALYLLLGMLAGALVDTETAAEMIENLATTPSEANTPRA